MAKTNDVRKVDEACHLVPPSYEAGTPRLLSSFGWRAALVYAVTLAAYWPALRGGFLWDDDGHVTRPDLQSLHGLKRIWLEVGATQQYYPVLHSAFWVEHRLWGDAALGYHLVNILLHATAACLFGLVLWRLWKVDEASPPRISEERGGTRRLLFSPALLAALLFALHPVCVESVAWISEQKNTLSTVFYLLAGLAFLTWHRLRAFDVARAASPCPHELTGWQPVLRPRAGSPCYAGSGWYVLSLVLFILALLSKSVTATFPAAVLVVLWWQRGSLSWKRDVLPLLPFFAIGIAGGLFTAWVERQYIGARGAAFDLSVVERGLLAGRVTWFYLAKLFWPAHLMFVYPRWPVSAGVGWQYLYPLGVVGVLAALWSIRRRTRGPLAGALFFVGSLFPALGFFNVYPFVFSYVADHFQYLAMLGVTAVAAAGWGQWEIAQSRKGAGSESSKGKVVRGKFPDPFHLPLTNFPFPRIVALVVLCVLGTLTWRDCRAYRDSETLYRTTLGKNPDAWMAHYNLGVVLGGAGRFPEAIAEYERAIALRPGMAEIHSDLGTAFIRSGRVPEAIDQFEEAVRLEPAFVLAHFNLSAALAQAGRVDAAIAQGEETLRLRPDFPEASYNLARIFQGAGRFTEAIAQFSRVLEQRPDFPGARINLVAARNDRGAALAGQGHLTEAMVQFQEALRLSPDDVRAHDNLGLALAQQDRLTEAKAQFDEALRLDPRDREARAALIQIQAAMAK